MIFPASVLVQESVAVQKLVLLHQDMSWKFSTNLHKECYNGTGLIISPVPVEFRKHAVYRKFYPIANIITSEYFMGILIFPEKNSGKHLVGDRVYL